MVSGTRGPSGPQGPGSIASTSLTPTSPFAESKKVAKTLNGLADGALEGQASSTIFLPAQGTKYEAYAFGYHTNQSKEMNIATAPKDGKVRGTICINISGHADGSRPDMIVATAAQVLKKEHKLDWWNDVDDKTFAALRSAAEKQGYGDPVTLEVQGLPKLVLTRAQIDKVATSDEGKGEAGDSLKRHFAMCNTYDVRVRLPDGQELNLRNVPRNKPETAEFATRIPIEFPAMPGTTIVEAWPGGSAGVAGYVEARQYKLHIGKEHFFDADKAMDVAEAYMKAHPEIRWGTEHEDDDLHAKHVNPPPIPYDDTP